MKQRDAFHRFPYLLQLFYFILISLGCILISANIGMLAAVLIFGRESIQDTPALLLIQAISAAGSFLVPALWIARMKKTFVPDYLHAKKTIPPKCLFLGLLAFLLASPVVSALQEWNMSWHFGPEMTAWEQYFRTKTEQAQQLSMQLIRVNGWGMFLCSLTVIAIGAGVCEEFFFRGGLQNLLMEWTRSRHAAIWITAVIFSIFHLDLYGFVPRSLLGALLGYLYVFSGTIWLPVMVHTLNNAITVTLYFLHYHHYITFDPENLAHDTSLLWPIAGLCGLILLFLYAGKRNRDKAVTTDRQRE